MAINGCSGSDSIIVSLTPKPQVTNNPLSKSICSGDSTKIALTSDVNGSTFNWTATLTSGTVTGFSADSGHLINQVLINTGAGPGIVHLPYHTETGKLRWKPGGLCCYGYTGHPGECKHNGNISCGLFRNPGYFFCIPHKPGIKPGVPVE